MGMQAWDNKDGRELAEVSFMFGELMTALDIQVVCEKIAKWLGGVEGRREGGRRRTQPSERGRDAQRTGSRTDRLAETAGRSAGRECS